MQAFRVRSGMRVFNSEGLGPMGFGLSAAIGGCIASGGRRTVCIDGDGGFVMNIQELETLRRLELPVKIFVLDNQGYGSIRSTQQRYFGGRLVASDPSSGLTVPPLAKVAASFGIRSFTIDSHDGIREQVASALDGAGPVLVEVKVPITQETRPRLMSSQRADGSFVSKPLEDLYPFLDRDEFRANMLVPPLPEGDG
jgi:acetolactate synthase-1/2/3 large subunit